MCMQVNATFAGSPSLCMSAIVYDNILITASMKLEHETTPTVTL